MKKLVLLGRSHRVSGAPASPSGAPQFNAATDTDMVVGPYNDFSNFATESDLVIAPETVFADCLSANPKLHTPVDPNLVLVVGKDGVGKALKVTWNAYPDGPGFSLYSNQVPGPNSDTHVIEWWQRFATDNPDELSINSFDIKNIMGWHAADAYQGGGTRFQVNTHYATGPFAAHHAHPCYYQFVDQLPDYTGFQAVGPYPHEMVNTGLWYHHVYVLRPHQPNAGTITITDNGDGTGHGGFSVNQGSLVVDGQTLQAWGLLSYWVSEYDAGAKTCKLTPATGQPLATGTTIFSSVLDGMVRMYIDGTKIIDMSIEVMNVTPPGGEKEWTNWTDLATIGMSRPASIVVGANLTTNLTAPAHIEYWRPRWWRRPGRLT